MMSTPICSIDPAHLTSLVSCLQSNDIGANPSIRAAVDLTYYLLHDDTPFYINSSASTGASVFGDCYEVLIKNLAVINKLKQLKLSQNEYEKVNTYANEYINNKIKTPQYCELFLKGYENGSWKQWQSLEKEYVMRNHVLATGGLFRLEKSNELARVLNKNVSEIKKTHEYTTPDKIDQFLSLPNNHELVVLGERCYQADFLFRSAFHYSAAMVKKAFPFLHPLRRVDGFLTEGDTVVDVAKPNVTTLCFCLLILTLSRLEKKTKNKANRYIELIKNSLQPPKQTKKIRDLIQNGTIKDGAIISFLNLSENDDDIMESVFEAAKACGFSPRSKKSDYQLQFAYEWSAIVSFFPVIYGIETISNKPSDAFVQLITSLTLSYFAGKNFGDEAKNRFHDNSKKFEGLIDLPLGKCIDSGSTPWDLNYEDSKSSKNNLE